MSWLRCVIAGALALAAACDGEIRDHRVLGPDAGSDRDGGSGGGTDDAGYLRWRDSSIPIDVLPRDASVRDATLPDGSPPDAAMDAGMQPQDSGPPEAPKPAVTFDPPGGGFSQPFMLKLLAGVETAKLHYTLDGSLPTASSPVALGPIAISATTLVRVIAVNAGLSSAVFNQSYFQLDSDVQDFTSNLPIVMLHMLGGAAPQPSSHDYVGATFGLFDASGARAALAGPAKHTSRLGIKIRGRSSRNQAKPSYTLELWGAAKEDAPASLMHMPADGDWVLYAPFDWDRSMMHNVFAYDLSRKIGRYAPRTQYCEVFLVAGATTKVTMASYAGVYVLMERVTRSADRIPVSKLDMDDIADPIRSGGYIVKVDEPDEPADAFTAAGMTFVYVDPDTDEVVPEQTQYIQSYLDACKRAAAASDGIDPLTGKHYSDLMDVPSFIDHHILSLLMKNPDAFALSSYFYKDRNGKLFAGPLWDFDLAMGAYDMWGQRSLNPNYWGPDTSATMFRRSFWGPLFNHAEFATAYWARWDELLASTFTSAKFRATIDAFEAQVTEAEARNRVRWPESAPLDDSYPKEIDKLQSWLDQRLTWIQANKGVTPPP
jgi:CotH kinase protein/Fn3 associated